MLHSSVSRRSYLLIGLLLLVFGISNQANAGVNEWDDSTHEILSGQYSGDGQRYLYFKPLPKWAFGGLGGISFPIDIIADPLLLKETADGNFLAVNIDQSIIDGVSWQQASFNKLVGDLNGDGLEDYFLQSQTHSKSSISIINDQTTTPLVSVYDAASLGVPLSADKSQLRLFDVNSDGKSDLVIDENGKSNSHIIVASGEGVYQHIQSSGIAVYDGRLSWNDSSHEIYSIYYDADEETDILLQGNSVSFNHPDLGLVTYKATDIVLVKNPATGHFEFVSNPSQSIINSAGKWNAEHNRLYGDFNGDSYKDILLQARFVGVSSLVLLSESGSDSIKIAQNIDYDELGVALAESAVDLSVGDINFDGRDDLSVRDKLGNYGEVNLYAKADGTFDKVSVNNEGYQQPTVAVINPDQEHLVYSGDYNNDGLTDLLVKLNRQILSSGEIRYLDVALLVQQPDGSYTMIWNPQDSLISGTNWTSDNTYKYYLGDFDGDGAKDMFLQSRYAHQHSVFLKNIRAGNQPQLTSVDGTFGGHYISQDRGYFNVNTNGSTSSLTFVPKISGSQGSVPLSLSSGEFVSDSYYVDPINYQQVGDNFQTTFGAVGGVFDVAEDGSATYSLPFQIPPGVAGLQPDIGLVYNNSASEGLVGLGWTLTGLSAISICPMEKNYEGEDRPLRLDADFSFFSYCIDGNKLKEMGNYTDPLTGISGTLLRPYEETFFKVIGIGSNGPSFDRFVVIGKDGSTKYYGTNEDSKLRRSTPGYESVRVWALDKVKDRASNYYEIEYEKLDDFVFQSQSWANLDISIREDVRHFIKRITYTGNENAGTLPDTEIVFDYEARESESLNSMISFQDVSGSQIDRVLKNVLVYRNSNLVQSYEMHSGRYIRSGSSYVGSITNYFLEKIYQCSFSFSGEKNCLAPTQFEYVPKEIWSTNVRYLPVANDHKMTVTKYIQRMPIDVNGDGVDELLVIDHSGASCSLYTGTCLFGKIYSLVNDQQFLMSEVNFGSKTGKDISFHVSDIDGDGLEDVVLTKADKILISDLGNDYYMATAFSSFLTGVTENGVKEAKLEQKIASFYFGMYEGEGKESRFQIFDINHDGVSDLIQLFRSSGSFLAVKVHLGSDLGDSGVFFTPAQNYTNLISWRDWNSEGDLKRWVNFSDTTGDGLPEILVFQKYTGSDSPQSDPPINKNGLSVKIFTDENNNNNYYYQRSYGFNYITDWPSDVKKVDFKFPDINLDGISDLVFKDLNKTFVDANGTAWNGTEIISISNGRTFMSGPRIVQGTNFFMGNGQGIDYVDTELFLDINQDGAVDRYVYRIADDTDSPIIGNCQLYVGDGLFIGPIQGGTSTLGCLTLTSLSPLSWYSTGSNQPPPEIFIGDFSKNAGLEVLTIHRDNSGLAKLYLASQIEYGSHFLKKVVNGFGVETNIEYASLYDSNVYQPDEVTPNSETTNVQGGGRFVVSEIHDGDKNARGYTSYLYKGLKYHKHGYGNLGFREVTETLHRPGHSSVINTAIYSQDYANHKDGMLLSSTTLIGNSKIEESTNNIEVRDLGNGRYYRYLSDTSNATWHLDGTLLSMEVTESTYDDYGNETFGKTTTSGPASSAVSVISRTNTFPPGDEIAQWLGQVEKTTVVSSYTDADGVTDTQQRSTSWTYHPNLGSVQTEMVQPDDPNNNVTTAYEYNVFGHATKIKVSHPSIQTRVTNNIYDQQGRHLVSTINPLGFKSNVSYHPVMGLPVSETNINGLTSITEYDGFGRSIKSMAPDGSYSETKYDSCEKYGLSYGAICKHPSQRHPINDAVYFVETKGSDGSESVVFFNKYGNEVARKTKGYKVSNIITLNQFIYQFTKYDDLHNVIAISEPTFSSDNTITNMWTTTTDFDELLQPTRSIDPNGTINEITYNPFVTISTVTFQQDDINGVSQTVSQTKKKTVDSLGQVVKVEDTLGSVLEYKYDAFGQQVKVIDTASKLDMSKVTNDVETTLVYDALGRKVSMNDPNKGNWRYIYDALGQMVLQEDAEGTKTCHVYDLLGRLVKRIDDYKDSDSSAKNNCYTSETDPHVTTWLYDTQPYGLGMLTKVAGPIGYGNDRENYEENVEYDSLGRVLNVRKQIGTERFVESSTYDNLGRLKTYTYPSGLKIQNNYYNGILDSVVNADTGADYWKLLSMNARGQVTEEKYGNGVSTTNRYDDTTGYLNRISTFFVDATLMQHQTFNFDGVGNLTSRGLEYANYNGIDPTPTYKTQDEKFSYDGLNRLLSFKRSNGAVANMQYYLNGNIKQKVGLDATTGVDSYNYLQTGAELNLSNCNAAAPGHNAVTSVVGNRGTIKYCYNGNGDMVSSTEGRTIEWTPFGKPARIAKYNNEIKFLYGPSRNRVKRTDSLSGEIANTYYLSGYEKRESEAAIEEKHYIMGKAIVTKENGLTTKIHYLHHDHLGSIVAITDAAGAVEDYFSFDPWGQRRNINWKDYQLEDTLAFTSSVTTKGFTGHEMLEAVGLIHMNGRLYDPQIGRFISADPIIQDATNLQAFNRYSYVQNNPLSHTDPSGYFFLNKLWNGVKNLIKGVFKLIKKHFQAVARVVRKIGRELKRALIKVPILQQIVIASICVATAGGCSVFGTMLYQALMDYSLTGDFKGALRGLAVGLVTMGVSRVVGPAFPAGRIGQTLARATTSGIVNRLQGGRFKDGFISSLKTAGTQFLEKSLLPIAMKKAQAGFNKLKGAVGSMLNSGMCPYSKSPVYYSTGEKYHYANDYVRKGSKLKLVRYYRSHSKDRSIMGTGWRTNFDVYLKFDPISQFITLMRPSGETISIEKQKDGKYQQYKGDVISVERHGDGWLLTTRDNEKEHYDANGKLTKIEFLGGYQQSLVYNENGQLIRVQDTDGRVLQFAYNAKGLVKWITAPGDAQYRYIYDNQNSLVRVYQPSSVKPSPYTQYLYEDPRFAHGLTGMIDESGVRYSSVVYDDHYRAIVSMHNAGSDKDTFVYNEDGSTTVTTALGKRTTYFFNDLGQTVKVEGHASTSCVASNSGYEFDDKGQLQSKTDWGGAETLFEYNDRGLEIKRVEAAGLPEERTIVTKWHKDFALPVKITLPGQTQRLTYDAHGNLIKKTLTDDTAKPTLWQKLGWAKNPHVRTWTYQYSDQHRLVAIDGPRNDVNDITRFAYDAQGNRVQVTNALNQSVKQLAHNADGLPTLIEDPNGVTTELVYNDRGWLTEKRVQAEANTLVTRYVYSDIAQFSGEGLVTEIHQANGSSLYYEYNGARYLKSIRNNQGERIEYSLDASGNRLAETTYSATGDIVREHFREMDEMGRLLKDIGAYGETTQYQYDKSSNVVAVVDPKERTTQFKYDALNRLVQQTDVLKGVIETHYDDNDLIASVTDQRGNTTYYERNGFGEVLKQISPDTGTTLFAYDPAGNLVSKHDARDVESHMQYDALNRLVTIQYPEHPEDNIHYTYDEADNGIGRLAKVEDPSGTTQYQYNALGQVLVQNTQVADQQWSTEYQYDALGQLQTLRYPSGLEVRYERDHVGRVVKVLRKASAEETFTEVTDSIAYLPFAGMSEYRLGNGIQEARRFDRNYRMETLMTAANDEAIQTLHYGYDRNSNIVSIQDAVNQANNRRYEYDQLNRLVVARKGSDASQQFDEQFSYDIMGNRLSYLQVANGQVVVEEAYHYEPNNNQLASVERSGVDGERATRSFGYDANGNTANDGRFDGAERELTFGGNNRLKLVAENGKTLGEYGYNFEGQRVFKETEQGQAFMQYSVNKQLLAEMEMVGGELVYREYVYVNGRRVAMVDGSNEVADVYYMHEDHLGAPRMVTDAGQEVVWQSDKMAFGMEKAVASLEMNLRFPGQVVDGESGYYQNYFREYDASIGRYIQSDPIGLGGGMNTFGYVMQNPSRHYDYYGLDWYDSIGGNVTLFLQDEGVSLSASFSADKNGLYFNLSAKEYTGQGYFIGFGGEGAIGSGNVLPEDAEYFKFYDTSGGKSFALGVEPGPLSKVKGVFGASGEVQMSEDGDITGAVGRRGVGVGGFHGETKSIKSITCKIAPG